jgi:hypothetical protein
MREGMPSTIRTDFLVHWTGKDIEQKYRDIEEEYNCPNSPDCFYDKGRCKDYVDRLRSTLIGRDWGLWMRYVKEKIPGADGSLIEYERTAPMTCFTEIKLSSVRDHARRYGGLGFGFSRDFVLKRLGAPVQYVSGTEHDVIVQNLAACWRELDAVESVYHIRNVLDTDELPEGLAETKRRLAINTSFLKNMSDPNHPKFPHDYSYLDEAEWRIVGIPQWSIMPRQIGIKKWTGIYKGPNGRYIYERWRRQREGRNYPEALIQFCREDLRVLIFPDSQVREAAFADPDIRKWFGDPPFPIMATVDECSHF